MDKRIYREYVAILKEELQPAMGCTEPIAVAYCAALARQTLGALPETVEVLASANIIKNVKSVIVPNTNGMRGIAAAAAAGIVADNADAQLQVLAELTPEQVESVGTYLEQAAFTVGRSDKDYVFDIQVRVTAGTDSAFVEIAGFHTNVIRVEKNGVVLQHKDYEESAGQHTTDRSLLTVENIIAFANEVDIADVQETLQRGLSMVCGERVKLTGVGRTDAGVHAERYVANFRTSSRIPIDRLPFAVNTHTPEDIVVREALEVADDFNAIGSCLKKEYTYRIYNSRIKNPFYVNRAYFYPKKLDEAVMDAAARAFEGTHDFRAVRSVGTETKTTVRTVHYCRVTRRGELLELKVCADGFLYNMVRAITGTVLYAAEGKLTAEDIPKILDSGDRTLAGPTVPPGGLYMTRLWYEDERLND